MKSSLVLIAAIALLVSNAQARTVVPALGLGNTPCRAFVKESGRQRKLSAAWLLGFFSADNVYDQHRHSKFLFYDEDHLISAVARQCEINPSSSIFEAAIEFMRQLSIKPR